MAYLDALTGLFNRAKCQQIFDILDKSFGDYAFVSIDMNGLKAVNDKYGHNEGDRFIKAFAEVFKEAFKGVGTTIRVGGDEFLAIVRSEHVADVKSAVKKMTELQRECSAKLPIPLEVAYGTAFKHEFLEYSFSVAEEQRIDAEKVYHLADERMYAMKSSMKSKSARKE
jgi:diguanylate cyclase (GGDEF)-like protein